MDIRINGERRSGPVRPGTYQRRTGRGQMAMPTYSLLLTALLPLGWLASSRALG